MTKMDIIFLSGETLPIKLCAEDRRFTIVQRMLRINQCTDAAMWYADKVGQLVPFFGAWSDGYKSREDAGHTNIVKFADAEIVEINDKGHIQSAVSNSFLRHCITRRQDNEQSIEPQADPTSPHFTGRFTHPDHARQALQPASAYHEDDRSVVWFHFNNLMEPPEVYCGSALDSDFDDEYWTHFIRIDFNSIFDCAEAMGVAR